jgi:hypothetical protein
VKLLRSYQNPLEAGFAQSLLESVGISAVLEHEASTSLSPAGVCAARLLVSESQFAAAERILADHPMHFSGCVDDCPRFGFWRGSVFGLWAYLGLVGLLLLISGASHFSFGMLMIVSFIGGIIGANYRLQKAPSVDSNA